MINENYRLLDPLDPLPAQRPAGSGIRRGDPVRARRGRTGGQGETGIVMRRRRWGWTATVRWTTLDVTTVPARNIAKIVDPSRERS